MPLSSYSNVVLYFIDVIDSLFNKIERVIDINVFIALENNKIILYQSVFRVFSVNGI